MTFRISSAVVALTVGATALLSACSTPAAAPTTSAASTPTAVASSPAAQPSKETTNSGKPTKAQVVAGYSKLVKDMAAGLPDDIVKKVTTCFADELYDKATPKTLWAIANAKPSDIDPADTSLFTDAQKTCQSKMAG